MKRPMLFILLMLLPLLALQTGGCQKKNDPAATSSAQGGDSQDPADKVLARVNGTPITQADVEMILRRRAGNPIGEEEQKEALKRLVQAELFYQHGLKLGLENNPRYRKAIRQLEMRLRTAKRMEMTRQVHQQEVLGKVTISDEDARAFHEKNKAMLGTEWHLGVIGFPDEASATEALARLKQGAPFTEVAARYLPTPHKASSKVTPPPRPRWDMGYMDWLRLPREWQQAVQGLQPGEVSQVLKGGHMGIRIFKLLEKRDKPDSSFEKLKSVIKMRLRQEKVQQLGQQFREKLRDAAEVVYP